MIGITRRGILRAIGLGAPLGTAMLPGFRARRDAPERTVLREETTVAGIAYYDAERAVPTLGAGSELVLRREPGNPYDPRAIEVLTADGTKLGYVWRVENEPLAAMMDAGVRLSGRVLHTHGTPGTRRDVSYRIEAELSVTA